MTEFIKAMRSLFCSLLFISMACGSFTVFGSSLKRTEPNKQQAADGDNLREVLRKARSSIEGIRCFRIRLEAPTVSKDAATIWEYVSPDRARLIWGKEELISIGKDVYHKKGDNSWEKFPGKAGGEIKTYVTVRALKHYIEAIEKADEVKFIGRDIVDGMPALAYEHTKYTNPNKTASFTTKTWIKEADGLLLKNQVSGVVRGSTPSAINITFYDYNADIKIEPPTEYALLTVPEGGKAATAPDDGVISYIEAVPDKNEVYLGKEGGGIGTGKGGGIGSGDGTGLGPGHGYNTGGGEPSIGGGTRSKAPATSVDQKPVQLNAAPRPNYTEEARKNKIQGVVRVRVLVGADGSVKQVKVVSGLPDGLNEEAIRSAYAIRFKPAMKAGQPVSYWVGLDIEFNLH